MSGALLNPRGLSPVGFKALGTAALLVAAAIAAALLPTRTPASATVELPPARTAALIAATAASADLRATGAEAETINASLPFVTGPLRAARPFATSGSGDLDQRRALLCLTQAVYYEAGFEPAAGRRAVAQVVLNRLRHPAFPKSVCGVVYQGAGSRVCQFTFVCDGALDRAPARDAWLQAEQIARAALSGYVEASVGEATHYHADYVAPRWAPMLAKVAQIGQHIFYRWPGAWGQPAAFTGRYIGEPRDPLSLRPPPRPSDAGEELAIQQAAVGPPVARAENDVGGLLDPSKGWTLNIPGPDDSRSAAAVAVASQSGKPAASGAGVTLARADGGPQIAGR